MESGGSAHAGPPEDDEEPVDPVQAYRDRASYTPERYLVVQPLAQDAADINLEVVERISSVLRLRSPSLAEPQPLEPQPFTSQPGEPEPTEPQSQGHEPTASPTATSPAAEQVPVEPQAAARS